MRGCLRLALALLGLHGCSKECLENGSSLDVRAFSPTGEPICDFEAVVLLDDGRSVATHLPDAATCVRGDVPELQARSYRVRVTAAGYRPAEVEVETSVDDCGVRSARVVSGPRADRDGIAVTLTP